jgi:hypothetical protein
MAALNGLPLLGEASWGPARGLKTLGLGWNEYLEGLDCSAGGSVRRLSGPDLLVRKTVRDFPHKASSGLCLSSFVCVSCSLSQCQAMPPRLSRCGLKAGWSRREEDPPRDHGQAREEQGPGTGSTAGGCSLGPEMEGRWN